MITARPAGAPARRAGPAARAAEQRATIVLAVALWASWTAATYLLEGRLLTLLRPEAVVGRVLYLLVANLAIGTVAAALLLRHRLRAGRTTSRQIGFPSLRRSGAAVLAGAVLGFAIYRVQGPPTLAAVVLLNGLAQVLVVSIAEVLICWSVVGAAVESALTPRLGRWATVVAALGAAVLFGIYHYAHSPPFNTLPLVVLLTVVGLATGLFFFVSRDVYGTIVFHNFMAAFGVLRALDQAGRLDTYATPRAPLFGAAIVGATTLIAVHVLWLRTTNRPPGGL